MFNACFNRVAVNFFAVGESHVVFDFYFYGEVVDLLKTFSNPRFKLHVFVEFEKRFAYAVANCRPAAIRFVRIRADVFHCDAVSDSPVSESFFVVLRGRFVAATSHQHARRQDRS